MRNFKISLLPIATSILLTGASAFAGDIERMSNNELGDPSNCANATFYPGANHFSADGRYVVYHSCATDIVSSDRAFYDIFVYDRDTGTNELVSVNSQGEPANSSSYYPSISADGRYVAFQSQAGNLDERDTDGTGKSDIFVRDLVTGVTEMVSVSNEGITGNFNSFGPAISSDGRYVAFWSQATNLIPEDTNDGRYDVFVHDRETGETEVVSVDSNGNQGDFNSVWPAISADGHYVAFYSSSSLVPNDTNGWTFDVFVHDRETGETEVVSVNSNGDQGDRSSEYPSISADGRFVAFHSGARNLVPGDTNYLSDVFVHDRGTGETEIVSVDSNGVPRNGNSYYPSINADGRYVAFYSRANLITPDTNFLEDVFVRDRETGNTVVVSTDRDGNQAYAWHTQGSISPDGTLVAFTSSGNAIFVPGSRVSPYVQTFVKETGLEPSGLSTNSPPEANAGGPYSVNEGGSALLDGSASSDPDDDQLTYEWDFEYDGSFDVDASGSATPSFSAAGLDGPATITVAVRVTDPDGESDVAVAEVTVNNVAPVIHTIIGATIDENGTATVSGTFSDVGTQDSFTVSIDWGDGITEDFAYAAGSTAFSETHQYPDDNPSGTPSDNYSVAVTVTDDDGGSSSNSSAAVTVNNIDPDVGDITVGAALVPVGTAITASASFTDVGTEDTHSGTWDWGDGTTTSGTVGSGSVEGSHTYSGAGVYTVELTVTDDDTGTDSVIYQYVVVYDPSAGFVTGGGWIESPAGAYVADPTLTGRANFGFVSKYKKGQSTPDGSTEFQFKAGDINFHSSSYEWLVVAGHQASFKGTGAINGAGNFGFMLKAVDAKLTPSTNVDRFNIKIWDKDNGDAVVYDNSLGTADDVEANQDIDGGQIVIHSKGK